MTDVTGCPSDPAALAVRRPKLSERGRLGQDAFGHSRLTRPLQKHLLRGTFDFGDLIALTLGALCAAGVLTLVHLLEARRAQ